MQKTTTVYLLLGSNLGDRNANLQNACERLQGMEGFEMIAESPVYISEPVDVKDDQPHYLNQVVKGEYLYTPTELLRTCEKIEEALGRDQKGKRKARTIDIDILLFGDELIETEELTIPHAELTKRPFALVPLLEIDRELINPASGKPFRSYLTASGLKKVVLYEDHVSRNFTA